MSSPIDDFGGKVPSSTGPTLSNSSIDNTGYDNSAPSEESDDSRSDKLTQWLPLGADQYKACGSTRKILESGMYAPVQIRNGEVGIEKMPINVDELLNFPDSQVDTILKEIEDFWNKSEKFRYHNFLHRRGYMFYGPHGSGKSSLVQQIIKQIINRKGLVLLCDEHPKFFNLAISQIRAVEPQRPLVCVFEDIDAIIKKYGESEILSILDGENQIDKVLNIATTNYPEYLDPRIVARPRRFDRVLRIDWPTKEVRRYYFKHKLKIGDAELDKWVDATDKFSFAACAELVISVMCLDTPFEKAVEKLRALNSNKASSKEYDTGQAPAGFAGFGKA